MGGSADGGTVFPVIRPGEAARVNGAIDAFLATESVAATEGPVRTLVDISDSRAFEEDRRIWRWFAAWVAAARANGTQLTAVKIGLFCFEWHASFVPQSGQAWMSLWKAAPEQLSLITAGALDAANDLDPGMIIVPSSGVTVADVCRMLTPDETPSVASSAPAGTSVPAPSAGWLKLAAHLRSKYQIVDEGPLLIRLEVDFGDGRTHGAVVQRCGGKDGEEWAQISAPVGRIENVDVVQLMTEVDRLLCGGVVAKGPYVSLRHAVPLANFDAYEVEAPLDVLVDVADRFEQRFTGRDDF